MSRDREARILGAGETIEVEGKEYRLRPVVAQHLCDLERDALRHYKRQYLQTFAENADLLGDGDGAKLVQGEMMKVARWDLNDLPQKTAYDVSHVPLNRHVKRWVEGNQGGALPDTDGGIKAVLVNALDTEQLTPGELKKMAGKGPLQGRVRYDQWWVTATMTGMISFIATSIRREHPEVTKDQVAGWPFDKIAEAARKVESVTSAALGNM